MIIYVGILAVDVFLFAGGYVAAASTTSIWTKFKKVSCLQFGSMYLFLVIKRYVRIMIPYLFSVFCYYSFSTFLSTGPHIANKTHDRDFDTYKFYTNFALGYYLKMSTNVAIWGWYLATDFRLYLTMPLLCYFTQRNRRCGIIIMSSMIAMTTLGTIMFMYIGLDTFYGQYEFFYTSGFIRGNIYYLGALLYFYCLKKKDSIKAKNTTQ